MPEGVNCSAPCAFRSYNKYRQKKDGTYELSKLPGAGGDHGTCRHGTMIQIGKMEVIGPVAFGQKANLVIWGCQTFVPWDTLLRKEAKK